MLLSNAFLGIFAVLLNNPKRGFTLRELSREAGISAAQAMRCVVPLARMGYVARRPLVKVADKERLLRCWAYCSSPKALESESFESLERPAYLIKKMGDLAGRERLVYAFTALAGAELVAPYVVPNEVHLYVEHERVGNWSKALEKNGIYPSRHGNIHLLFPQTNVFYGLQTVRGYSVVSSPQLFVDLFHFSEEAAGFLAKKTGLL